MKKRIVITGLGAVSAHGHTVADICAPTATTSLVKPLSKQTLFQQITDYDGAGTVGGRLKKKLDPFAFHGLCAADMALKDSCLVPQCGGMG